MESCAQKLANELKRPITVCHLPPGTSKWNKIEHRLFSFHHHQLAGKPLRSYRTIVQLIATTKTDAGLKVRAELDEKKYPKRHQSFQRPTRGRQSLAPRVPR